MATRLERLLTVLQRLSHGQSLNAGTLAHEFDVSRRTVFRDLETLRNAGVSIRIDEAHAGYQVNGSDRVAASLPPDALAELLLRACGSQLPQSKVQKSQTDRAIQALLSHLDVSDRDRVVQLLGCTRAPGASDATAIDPARRECLDKLLHAIREQVCVAVTISDESQPDPEATTVYPVHIKLEPIGWTLDAVAAKDHGRLRIALTRMQDVHILNNEPVPKLTSHLRNWHKPDREYL